jgi:hypothetical protein
LDNNKNFAIYAISMTAAILLTLTTLVLVGLAEVPAAHVFVFDLAMSCICRWYILGVDSGSEEWLLW